VAENHIIYNAAYAIMNSDDNTAHLPFATSCAAPELARVSTVEEPDVPVEGVEVAFAWTAPSLSRPAVTVTGK
jgi:hypothetical protein